MIHYIIEWTNGAKESIYGSNYINALRINGITPEMEYNIIKSFNNYKSANHYRNMYNRPDWSIKIK